MRAGSRGKQRRACCLAHLMHTSGYSKFVQCLHHRRSKAQAPRSVTLAEGVVSCLRNVCPRPGVPCSPDAGRNMSTSERLQRIEAKVRQMEHTLGLDNPQVRPARPTAARILCGKAIQNGLFQNCAAPHHSAASQAAPERPTLSCGFTCQLCLAAVLWHRCPLCGGRMKSGLENVN